jgi:hypothetical protein
VAAPANAPADPSDWGVRDPLPDWVSRLAQRPSSTLNARFQELIHGVDVTCGARRKKCPIVCAGDPKGIMPLRTKVLLGLYVASGMVFPVMAQQNPPFQGPHCDAFTKNAEGEWVARQDMTILGPFGPVNIKAGQPVDDEMQERLDDLCK